MTDKICLQGEVHCWNLGGKEREYLVTTVPYGVARQFFKTDIYNAKTNHGEQRDEIDSHVKKLQAAMAGGTFTPTVVSIGLKPSHRKKLERLPLETKDASGQPIITPMAELVVSYEDGPTFPLLDGGQRFAALRRLHKNANDAEQQARIESLPITVVVYLDGDTKADFVNLNLGKAVDAAHLLSMRVQQKAVAQKDLPYYKLALEVAKLLNEDEDSPFYKQIRFDSRGMAPLTINTLCSRGASDIATSLIGLARIALHASSDGPLDAEAVVDSFKLAIKVIRSKAPLHLAPGRFLTPPPDGTRGSATMLVGVAALYIYRLSLDGQNDDVVEKELIDAIEVAFSDSMAGAFGGPVKRELMGEFAKQFFQNVDVDKHCGVPKELVRILSASTFRLPKLPKERKPKPPKEESKKRGRKKAAQPAASPAATEAQPNPCVEATETPLVTNNEERMASLQKKQTEREALADSLTQAYDIPIREVEEETPSGELVETFDPVDNKPTAPWEDPELLDAEAREILA